MFGDAIPFARANALLGASAGCDLPFQCAHGRPSMVPIALPKAMHEKRVSIVLLPKSYVN